MKRVIQIGETVLRLELYIENDGAPVTGLTGSELPTVALRRLSDGYYLDFNDSTFKASGHTTKNYVLAEITGDTQLAGRYAYTLDTSSIITDYGDYEAIYTARDVTPNQLDSDLLRFVKSDLAEKILCNKLEIDQVNSELVVYEEDGTTEAYRATLTDKDGGNIVLTGTAPVNRTP